MSSAGLLLFIGCLMTGALCQEWKALMPDSIQALSGSCVEIPCSFEVLPIVDQRQFESATGKWTRGSTLHYDKRRRNVMSILLGDLLLKNCTSQINSLRIYDTDTYHFRVEAPPPVAYAFPQAVQIQVTDTPPKPTLTPSTLNVMEGTSVSLGCSAAAPCPSLPPTLNWTPRLGDSEEELRENRDKTKSMTSVMTFTASHLHHEMMISCAALYERQSGNSVLSSKTHLLVSVLFSPKDTSIEIIEPSGTVLEEGSVTLSCSSKANPPIQGYTWFRVDGEQVTLAGSRMIFTTVVTKRNSQFYCEASNLLGLQESSVIHLLEDMQYPPKSTTVSVSPSGPVLEGRSVTLTCKANPPVNGYTWYRVNGDQVTLLGFRMTFTTQVREQNSQFYCEASNQRGEQKSSVIQVDVQYPPRNTKVSVSSSGSALEGSSVTLTCNSKANPAVSYMWYKVNGSEMLPIAKSQSLILQETGDMGLFCCEVQNLYGRDRSDNFLHVRLHSCAGGESQVALPFIICGLVIVLWILSIVFGVYKYTRLSRMSRGVEGRGAVEDTYTTLQIASVSPEYDIIHNQVNGNQGRNSKLNDYENAAEESAT